MSTNNIGVVGGSTNQVGVFGSTASGDVTKPGVLGTATGAGGVGVTGETGANNSMGVYGNDTAAGTAVYGRSTSGRAFYADGNAGQARDKGGFVKAMLFVDPFLPADQYIVRCYNDLTNSSTGNCGFTVTRFGVGSYDIDFGFQINDRFFSLTLSSATNTAGLLPFSVNTVRIFIWGSFSDPSVQDDSSFWIIVY